MEFEKAIFRVYERCVESFREDGSDAGTKSCRIFEYVTLSGAFLSLITLIILHISYVGNSGCLGDALAGYDGFKEGQPFDLPTDTLIGINLSPNFAPYVIDDDDDLFPKADERRRTLFDVPRWLLDADEGETNEESDKEKGSSSDTDAEKREEAARMVVRTVRMVSNQTYDYLFTQNNVLAFMDTDLRAKHDFRVLNVTLSDTCFGSGLAPLLLPVGGVDVAVNNMLMKTVAKPGIVRTRTNELYSWSEGELITDRPIDDWVIFKLNVLLASLLSFACLSTITALLVRILISSGVVLIFPLFWAFGVPIYNNRVITLSYPWLGVPIEMLRAQNISPVPFIMSHVVKILMYYILYEAAQMSFSLWFYGSAFPGQKELWLYAIVMLWEYYSMIYVRSKMSIIVFPRVSLALFLIYHFYLYSQPGGFHSLALLVMFLTLAWLMAVTVRKYEVPSFLRGEVAVETPRMMINNVPWPVYNQALPPDESLFMPPTGMSRSVYSEEDPPRPGSVPGAGGAEGGAAGTGASISGSQAAPPLPPPGDEGERDGGGEEASGDDEGDGDRSRGFVHTLGAWTTGLVGRRQQGAAGNGAVYSRLSQGGRVDSLETLAVDVELGSPTRSVESGGRVE